ncbi:hypothetical protein [Streptomyces sp. NPDC002845]
MERLKEVLAPLRDRTVQCPNCCQWALVTGGELAECLFCPWAADPKLYAWDYVVEILDLPWRITPTDGPFQQPARLPIDPCPRCGEEAVVPGVVTAATPDSPITFCFDCGVAFPVEEEQDSQRQPRGGE